MLADIILNDSGSDGGCAEATPRLLLHLGGLESTSPEQPCSGGTQVQDSCLVSLEFSYELSEVSSRSSIRGPRSDTRSLFLPVKMILVVCSTVIMSL